MNVNQAGKVSLEWAQASGQSQEGTLLTLSARLAKANETIHLDLVNVKLFAEDLKPLAVDVVDGVIAPFSGETENYDSKVERDKQWTILLENECNPFSINQHTVSVKNRSGKEMDIAFQVNSSKEFVVLPKTNYKPGTYTLEMTDQILGSNGEMLNKPKRLIFSVK